MLELDRTFQIAMPAAATGGWVDIKWDASWRVAALLAGGPERGKVELTTPTPQVWRFAAADSSPTTFKPLLVAGPVLSDVLPSQGLPYLTITVTPTYPTGVRDPGLTIVYRGRPHETAAGVWDLTDIGYDSSGPVLVAQQTRQDIDTALGSLTSKLSQADTDHAAVTVSLADSAQALLRLQQTQATADYLRSLADLADILTQLNALSDAALTTSGYALTLSADGQTQTLRADSSRSLGLRTNADGSVTIYGDPALFGVRTNADTSQTLYRSTP